MYHPRKFSIAVIIHPDYDFENNPIIASTLYDHLIAELQALDPLLVMTSIKDNWRHRYHIDLLKAKGFQEVQRECWSALDVMAFDFTLYKGIKEKLLTEGIEIKTFQEREGER